MASRSPVTGHAEGPLPIGVTTLQLDDHSRKDPGEPERPRRLQTEIWYPATDDARGAPKNLFSEFLGRGVIEGSIAAAEARGAIGGYRDGLTVTELDATWPNAAVRDAKPRAPAAGTKWPLVIFSHGSGAFRASYIYITEFLASHGFVVMACDHTGNARYTQVDGKVITPGGKRSEQEQMQFDRPRDLVFLVDEMERMASGAGDSRFAGRVDSRNAAVVGMSFGGFAAASALEFNDVRIKAAVLQCPWFAVERLSTDARENKHTPVLLMTGREDTVLGAGGAEKCSAYFASHAGHKCLVELLRGGHVSFTSCELYNTEYGNGIGSSCASLTSPGESYTPTPILKQHEIINAYALAFLDMHLRPQSPTANASVTYVSANHYPAEIRHATGGAAPPLAPL
eukprot:g23.t1